MFRTAFGEWHRYYMVAISDEAEAKAAITDFLDNDIPGLECRTLPASVLTFVGLAKGDIREWVLG
ncbi:MAG: hypothetical protein K2P68_04715 [Sphingomonas sp.]|nr:hypothetical protein [Sphingomonas sp.]